MSQGPARQAEATATSREASSHDAKASWDASGSELVASSNATGNYAPVIGGGKLKLYAIDCTEGHMGHNASRPCGKLIGVPWDTAPWGWHNAAARITLAIAIARIR